MAKKFELKFSCEEVSAKTSYSKKMDIEADVSKEELHGLLDNLPDDALVEYIADHFSVEEVFEKETIERWAEDNGYVKHEDND